MSIDRLTIRQRRALAVFLLCVVVALCYAVLALPLLSLAEGYDQRIERLVQRAALATQAMAEGEAARQRLVEVERAERRHGYYLARGDTALAAAQLQQHIKQTAETVGGSIVSSQVLGDRQLEGVSMVVLRVNMRVDITAFEKILHRLEARPPVLLIDSIHVASRPSGSTARWAGSSEAHVLDVSLDVLGYGNPAHDT